MTKQTATQSQQGSYFAEDCNYFRFYEKYNKNSSVTTTDKNPKCETSVAQDFWGQKCNLNWGI